MGMSISNKNCLFSIKMWLCRYLQKFRVSSGDIGRCRVGRKVSAMCLSIFCRSTMGKTCGDSIPEVAALMYYMVCEETVQR